MTYYLHRKARKLMREVAGSGEVPIKNELPEKKNVSTDELVERARFLAENRDNLPIELERRSHRYYYRFTVDGVSYVGRTGKAHKGDAYVWARRIYAYHSYEKHTPERKTELAERVRRSTNPTLEEAIQAFTEGDWAVLLRRILILQEQYLYLTKARHKSEAEREWIDQAHVVLWKLRRVIRASKKAELPQSQGEQASAPSRASSP